MSCNIYTRYVPEGEELLVKNEIIVEGDKNIPRGTDNIIKQKPNRKNLLFLIKMNLILYNWGNGKPENFFSRIGKSPVIIDSSIVSSSATQLQDYFFNHGYFNTQVSYEIVHRKSDSKKAEVKYYVNPGKQYYIRKYKTDIQTERLQLIENYNSNDRFPKEGKPYDAEILDKERARLVNILKNKGCYGFSKNYISFTADTLLKGDSVDVTLVMAQNPAKINDSVYYQDHEKYYINNIYIRPDYNYATRNSPADTMEYLDYYFVYDTLKYKARYFTDAIHFKKSDIYNQHFVKETYSHFAGYQTFQATEINFTKVGRDSTGFLLDARIQLLPQLKRTFTINTEAINTSSNFGANLSLGFTNRNLFGGGEALQFKFNTGLEFQATIVDDKFTQTFEVGVEIGIDLPRFLLPFNTVGLLPKRMQPKSKISLSINRFRRTEFQRETFNGKLSYIWKETRHKTHKVDLVDLSYSNIFNPSPSFLENLNDIQQQAFQSEFIGASKYTFTYNEQVDPKKKNYNFLTSSLEIAGNTISLIENNFNLGESTKAGPDQLFGVQYYQFLRLEADYRFYWNFSENLAWINRFFMGYVLPYGNSVVDSATNSYRIPAFSRTFFMGGNNDLRSWPAYRLGAGTQLNTNYGDGSNPNFAIGTYKFLINSEYRFPIVSFLKGALFADLGNIWLTGGLEDLDSKVTLKFSNFVNELAIGSGFGLRLDFDFFVIRFDVGAKVRDPGRLNINNGWVLDKMSWNTVTYNIALGYPF